MTSKRQKKTTIAFTALGCPKNTVDSERMLAEIAEAGFLITSEHKDADVIIINTCGFIAAARDEALDEISRAVEYKNNRKYQPGKVIVTGCLSQRYGDGLLNDISGIDAIVGLADRDNIVSIIKQTLNSQTADSYLDGVNNFISDDRGRLLITPPHYAYLRISQGCSRKCAFCTIPAIRGPFRSKPQQQILDEAAELADCGVVELNIIAQDTTNYGRDMKVTDGLARLLNQLEKISGLKWLRLMYMYPTGITDKLIETIAGSEKIVPYFDIPIQHINNDILQAMKRPDTREQTCNLIEKLRSAVKDCVLRTTVIVGFPGETDSIFDELMEFVEWAQFDALGCFPFYAEDGTLAAQLPDQLPEQVKQQRLERLMLAQQKIAFDKNNRKTGAEIVCLVDSATGKNTAQGRYYGQAPDIDSICIIENCTAGPGSFIRAKVIGCENYDLIVRQTR